MNKIDAKQQPIVLHVMLVCQIALGWLTALTAFRGLDGQNNILAATRTEQY